MLQHIALEVKESDIKSFYSEILGGQIVHEFSLGKTDAEKIFQYTETIDACKIKLKDLELELFIHECIEQDSLQHICLQLKNAPDAFLKAFEKNYWTHLRKSGDKETYFIKDKNGNMFELKEEDIYYEDYIE